MNNVYVIKKAAEISSSFTNCIYSLGWYQNSNRPFRFAPENFQDPPLLYNFKLDLSLICICYLFFFYFKIVGRDIECFYLVVALCICKLCCMDVNRSLFIFHPLVPLIHYANDLQINDKLPQCNFLPCQKQMAEIQVRCSLHFIVESAKRLTMIPLVEGYSHLNHRGNC